MMQVDGLSVWNASKLKPLFLFGNPDCLGCGHATVLHHWYFSLIFIAAANNSNWLMKMASKNTRRGKIRPVFAKYKLFNYVGLM